MNELNAQPESAAADSDAPTTSSSLLDRVKAHEPQAWRRLLDLYGPLVFHWCRRGGLHPEDAGDVLQDVFRSVAANIARFRRLEAGDTFRGWLWSITRNKLRDHFRTRRHQPEVLGGSEAHRWFQERPCPDSLELAGEGECATQQHQLFRRALDLIHAEFEERTWQAFWRAAVDGHETADIAADLGMTPNAVRKAKSRILLRLREELSDVVE